MDQNLNILKGKGANNEEKANNIQNWLQKNPGR